MNEDVIGQFSFNIFILMGGIGNHVQVGQVDSIGTKPGPHLTTNGCIFRIGRCAGIPTYHEEVDVTHPSTKGKGRFLYDLKGLLEISL